MRGISSDFWMEKRTFPMINLRKILYLFFFIIVKNDSVDDDIFAILPFINFNRTRHLSQICVFLFKIIQIRWVRLWYIETFLMAKYNGYKCIYHRIKHFLYKLVKVATKLIYHYRVNKFLLILVWKYPCFDQYKVKANTSKVNKTSLWWLPSSFEFALLSVEEKKISVYFY